MHIDVEGRVNNTVLAAGKPMLPLHEALVNSIQAIEDAGHGAGQIRIDLIRDRQMVAKEADPTILPVTDVRITDNGIGFTDANFRSFNTSDTTFKKQRGGKGVGRFLWLVAFNEVSIKSTYADSDSVWQSRRFRFIPRGDGIADHINEASSRDTASTVITLSGFKKEYRDTFPKKPETIASHIAEHCLEFFIRGNCPTITLHDPSTETVIDLNRLFDQGMYQKAEVGDFEVKGNTFHITHVRLYSKHSNEHQAHYCANDRVVQSSRLTSSVPNLPPKLEDEEGKRFVYAAYVESDVLNETVNAERTSFAIDDSSADILPDDVAWSDIDEAVKDQSKDYLSPYTDPVRTEKKQHVREYIETSAQMYRPLLRYIDDMIDSIDTGSGDDSLEIELFKAYHEIEVETKAEGARLLNADLESDEAYTEFLARFESCFERVEDLKKTDLARYVLQREAVIEFLQKLLARRDDGKHHLESEVHNVIFPMGSTSEDTPFDDHNLWLLDERLAYSAFVASDKQLRTLPTFGGDSQREPDIIAYDRACAFSSSSDLPYRAITLIELKRPMRGDYSEDENPFTQLQDYMDLLRENKATTADGRPIPITEATPFHCYVLCDLRPATGTRQVGTEKHSRQDARWARLFRIQQSV